MSDYLNVIYDEKLRPYTSYPMLLATKLFNDFELKSGQSLLEPGCGRGEILKCFKTLGLDVEGIDLSPETPKYLPDFKIKVGNVESEGLPYDDNSFDIIYTKSFLEHFHYPENFIKEAFRILKPGGKLINLVPDWESNYLKYFDDYTHRTPFSSISLKDIHLIHGFDKVEIFKFRQLPILWKYTFLNYLCPFVSLFVPLRTKSKLRWLREVMLIGYAIKPQVKGKK